MYGERSNGKQHGVVLTKPEVVGAILDLVGYVADRNLQKVTILEPASGDGAFALEIISRLYDSSVRFGFGFPEALKNIKLFEIDGALGDALETNISNLLVDFGLAANPIQVNREDFLQSRAMKVDMIVGNPPYVRHDNIPELLRETYRRLFQTFRYRADLYVPFFEKSLGSLQDGGKLGFICANRWLRNQYGRPLRRLIGEQFSMEKVIDLTKASPFQEEVIAYPAISVIGKDQTIQTTEYYEVDDVKSLDLICKGGVPKKSLLHVKGRADNWFHDFTLQEHKVHCHLSEIEAQGFSIGIGVATGCDRVFIRDDFAETVEHDLLLPIIGSKDLKGDRFKWNENYLLNPFDAAGRLIDLDEFPLANAYLTSHGENLRGRHLAKKRPAQWYRTIDQVDGKLTSKPKILLPDISGNRRIFIDPGKFYPHHNIYYITGRNIRDLQLLAALLMSSFVRDQLKAVGTQMNGGYPRWQSQNLRKLRIPLMDGMEYKTQEELVRAYLQDDQSLIDEKVDNIVRTPSSGVPIGQLELFAN